MENQQTCHEVVFCKPVEHVLARIVRRVDDLQNSRKSSSIHLHQQTHDFLSLLTSMRIGERAKFLDQLFDAVGTVRRFLLSGIERLLPVSWRHSRLRLYNYGFFILKSTLRVTPPYSLALASAASPALCRCPGTYAPRRASTDQSCAPCA